MPLPVITNTYRCTINGTLFDGIAPRNVLHIQGPSTNEHDVGVAVWNAMQTDQFGVVPGDFQPETITVLKLDGTSPGIDVPITDGSPASNVWGPAGGQFIPEGCAVISLRTGQRGARGRGRVFIGPIREDAQNNGVLAGGVGTLTTAWADFAAALADQSVQLVVASYLHADANGVTNLHADLGIGTQRRRLLQQRH